MAADAAEARARRIWSCIAEAGFALGAREVVARAGVAPSSLPAVVAACRAEA